MTIRAGRVSHWIGIVLALPLAVLTAIEIVSWTRGGYPPTVGISEVLFVIGAVLIAMLSIYAMCRAIGFVAVRLARRDSR